MERIAPSDTARLANILSTMPVSTIAGLLTPYGEWRERAALLVAEEIVGRLNPPAPVDRDQMALPI